MINCAAAYWIVLALVSYYLPEMFTFHVLIPCLTFLLGSKNPTRDWLYIFNHSSWAKFQCQLMCSFLAKLLLSLFVPSLLHQVTWKKLIIHWSLLAGQSGLKSMPHAIRCSMHLAYDMVFQQHRLIKSKSWL
jgi:hypothetical protein